MAPGLLLRVSKEGIRHGVICGDVGSLGPGPVSPSRPSLISIAASGDPCALNQAQNEHFKRWRTEDAFGKVPRVCTGAVRLCPLHRSQPQPCPRAPVAGPFAGDGDGPGLSWQGRGSPALGGVTRGWCEPGPRPGDPADGTAAACSRAGDTAAAHGDIPGALGVGPGAAG